jgi:prepilin-type N-terminal cleavage/methylation domain-containing protein
MGSTRIAGGVKELLPANAKPDAIKPVRWAGCFVRRVKSSGCAMVITQSGFSLLEVLTTLLIMGTIVAFALPGALSAVKNYKLHADATAIASYLNVVRMKAVSQYAPYRLNIDTTTGSYNIEQLCGGTPSSTDSACTSPYAARTTPQIDVSGTQFINAGNRLSSCHPAGVTVFPLTTITADPSGCPTLVHFYFNTRGGPVDSSGNVLSNGGNVIYLTNPSNLYDAVTISLGGRVSVWNYSPSTGAWVAR